MVYAMKLKRPGRWWWWMAVQQKTTTSGMGPAKGMLKMRRVLLNMGVGNILRTYSIFELESHCSSQDDDEDETHE